MGHAIPKCIFEAYLYSKCSGHLHILIKSCPVLQSTSYCWIRLSNEILIKGCPDLQSTSYCRIRLSNETLIKGCPDLQSTSYCRIRPSNETLIKGCPDLQSTSYCRIRLSNETLIKGCPVLQSTSYCRIRLSIKGCPVLQSTSYCRIRPSCETFKIFAKLSWIYPEYSDVVTPNHSCFFYLHVLICLKLFGCVANSEDPDQMPHSLICVFIVCSRLLAQIPRINMVF